ncbi:putative leucine-rich repeat extensin-like protein 3 [Iris pallida]|uniref:Leucine-rich repeat extensin-like protein 3 n=1 Tax=Iris pallida TaxID=29817 RepID=A0AAX6HVY9_IRIPA|nr:putative leucine-rich repeat extensin-like protein 3 [Iris pallida]
MLGYPTRLDSRYHRIAYSYLIRCSWPCTSPYSELGRYSRSAPPPPFPLPRPVPFPPTSTLPPLPPLSSTFPPPPPSSTLPPPLLPLPLL